ncbi:ATP-binding protein [Nocardiopsis sp. HNM0947]|uniref:ATP-binding protein n=1 Tax=Nocardiopsis coralli TaxID=2772213 RepID=A0ABR9PAS9_9ACTN|nr:ATP-binding protein [Nocardiopsis coralli]MBE3000937.1 ATP-binding protein [Nocardiopsis coralli]
MDAGFSITLPRQAYTVAVVRDILDTLLSRGGLCRECVDDILLAVSEAGANAVEHGGPAPDYTVEAELGPRWCEVRISHTGRAPDEAHLAERFANDPVPLPSPEAESGRGIVLMRYLMDEVAFQDEPRTMVALRKRRTACDRPLDSPPPERSTRYALL